MSVLFQGVRYALYPEQAYMSGKDTTKYAKTKLTTAENVVPFSLFLADSTIKMPGVVTERTQIGGSTITNYKRFRVASKVSLVDGQTEHYIMDKTYLDAINSQTEGQNPGTMCLHWEDGNTRYEAYGCFIKQLDLSVPDEDVPKMTATWQCGAVITDANDLSSVMPAFASGGVPLLRKDCAVSINGVNTLFKSFDLSIKLLIENVECTNGYEALIAGKEVDGTIITHFPTTAQFNALIGTTITGVTLVFTLGSKATITITDCEVYVDAPFDTASMSQGLRQVNLKFATTSASGLTIA